MSISPVSYTHLNIDKLISEMTLEEKASLCSAADAWHTKRIDRLNLPSAMVSDGPHGLRKEDDSPAHFGLLDSIEAICFPTASALACSFDRELIENVEMCIRDRHRTYPTEKHNKKNDCRVSIHSGCRFMHTFA